MQPPEKYTDEEWEIAFGPVHAIRERWGYDDHPKTLNEIEAFLEESGYYARHGL